MNEKQSFDFWYAVNNTDIVLMPGRHLETFGATVLNYRLISEMMDSVNQIRVREGRLRAHQPHIITPEAYADTVLEGFGEQASQYVDWLRQHDRDIRILQYGYTLKQEAFSEHVITDSIDNVVDRIKQEVQAENNSLTAVVQGVDDPWDVCLVKLFWEVIRQSAAANIRDLQRKQMFNDDGGVPHGVRTEIENAFAAAAKDSAQIESLARMLQRYNLFEEYEDRFFSLVRGK